MRSGPHHQWFIRRTALLQVGGCRRGQDHRRPTGGTAIARNDRPTEARSEADERRPSISDLIRPGLLRAFPLPATGGADEERFRSLLDSLARRTGSRT